MADIRGRGRDGVQESGNVRRGRERAPASRLGSGGRRRVELASPNAGGTEQPALGARQNRAMPRVVRSDASPGRERARGSAEEAHELCLEHLLNHRLEPALENIGRDRLLVGRVDGRGPAADGRPQRRSREARCAASCWWNPYPEARSTAVRRAPRPRSASLRLRLLCVSLYGRPIFMQASRLSRDSIFDLHRIHILTNRSTSA